MQRQQEHVAASQGRGKGEHSPGDRGALELCHMEEPIPEQPGQRRGFHSPFPELICIQETRSW